MAEVNRGQHWAELYRIALFEEDRDKVPLLLEQAHQAIEQRVRELWDGSENESHAIEKECRELSAAAYYLGLLRNLETREAA